MTSNGGSNREEDGAFAQAVIALFKENIGQRTNQGVAIINIRKMRWDTSTDSRISNSYLRGICESCGPSGSAR